MIFFFILEISVRVYDYYFPNCQFMKSDSFSEVEVSLQREICHAFYDVKLVDDPLRYLPNQHFGNIININSEGFRGQELNNNVETYRIFFVGGSTAFGAGTTTDSTSIPGYLQSFFNENESDIPIEVVNAGVSGSYSYLESKYIQNKIINFDPDLIIVYDGWNDIHKNYDYYFSDSFINTPMETIFETALNNGYLTLPEFFVRTYTIWKHDSFDRNFNESYMDEKTNSWKNTWDNICKISKNKNFEMVITLQPILGSSNKELSSFEQKSFKKYDMIDVLSNYQKYADELSNFDYCKNTIDLRDTFNDVKKPLYFDGVHINDYGNKVVAKKIYDKIYNMID